MSDAGDDYGGAGGDTYEYVVSYWLWREVALKPLPPSSFDDTLAMVLERFSICHVTHFWLTTWHLSLGSGPR